MGSNPAERANTLERQKKKKKQNEKALQTQGFLCYTRSAKRKRKNEKGAKLYPRVQIGPDFSSFNQYPEEARLCSRKS
ncbi:MAG: hypothetical protein J6E31_03920 [Pyramidobacter sp.]|nr:hypothetical protein [Pyramidobacter sp.]